MKHSYRYIYIIVVVFFAFSVVLPLLFTIANAFYSIGHARHTIDIQALGRLIVKSIFIAGTTGIVSTVVGFVLSFAIFKSRFRFLEGLKVILLLPLFFPPYIFAVAWQDFFFLILGRTDFLLSEAGVVWILITVYSPLSMLIIGNALSNIEDSLEQAALTMIPRNKVIFKLIIPLIKPALFSSFVLVFIFSLSEFSVAGFYGVSVFTTEIFTQFSAFYNYSVAITESLFLIFISLVLLLTERKYLAGAEFITVNTKGKNSYYRIFFPVFFTILWTVITVFVPFATIIIQFAGRDMSDLLKAFLLLKSTFIPSITLSAVGAVIITVLGFIYAYFSYVDKIKSSNFFVLLLLLTFAIPSTTLGISLIKFYNNDVFNFIYSSFAIIIIGYIGKYTFISAKLIENTMKQIPFSLEEAGLMQGAGRVKRILKIWIPLSEKALFWSLIIVFLFSLGELGLTIMVYPPGTELMPIKVYTIMANAPQSLTSAMIFVVFSVTLICILTIVFIRFLISLLIKKTSS